MPRRVGRGGPRGRGDNSDRNGYRQTGPNHIPDRGGPKGYKSFERRGPTDNPYKKINNLPDNDRRSIRNNINRRLQNGGRNADSSSSSSATTSKSLSEMFKITVPQGQRFDRELIISKIREGVGQNFTFYNYEKNTGNSAFFVVGRELAESIKEVSRRITLDNGFQLVLLATRSRIEEVQIDDHVRTVLREAVGRNYNVASKVLSLSNFVQDEVLRTTGYFLPASKKNVLEEIVNIIVANCPELVAINLSNNRIYSLEPLKNIVTSCPNVKALDLSNNSIANKNEFKVLSQLSLLELNVEGNPFCDRFKNLADVHSCLQEYFPTLQKMDGETLGAKVSFGVTDSEVAKMIEALPPPVQYSIPEEVKPFVLNFVKQYFETFDTPDQRSNLAAAYGSQSVITYSFSNLPKRNDGSGRSSHNLLRLTDEALYNRYAHFGTDFIMRFFTDFPQFQHHFETFSIDVPIVEGQTMMVCINGQLTEIMKDDKPRLAFSRLWMLSMVDGKPVIQNDQYHISSLSNVALDEFKARPKMDTMSAGPTSTVFVPPVIPSLVPIAQPIVQPTLQPMAQPILQPMVQPTMQPAPIISHQPITTSPAAPIAGSLITPGGDALTNVQKLMNLTKMVQPYAEKCLLEAGNDMNKAYQMFKQVFNQLPPEAFQK